MAFQFWLFCFTFGITVSLSAEFRVERTPLASGADLLTYFEVTDAGRDLPVFAALRDSLNSHNPKDDRLRQVWVFTYSRPSVWQRIAGGTPFFYRRTSSVATGKVPKAVLDLGSPGQGLVAGVGMAMLQAHVLDPFGIWTRLTTRSYGGNLGEYRRTHLREAADLIAANSAGNPEDGLTDQELSDVGGRLFLTGQLLGGMVRDEYLDQAYAREHTRSMENRAHNWELLRQTAEENGLFFQPLPFESMPKSFAMVWVAARELTGAPRPFDSQFLDFRNPFADGGLKEWKGYKETWDRDGEASEMIPLALYSLDYPGVPYRLIDFRRLTAPKRFEMVRKAADDVTTGVLGFTTFGNLGYTAAKSSFLFVQKRHGGATDRSARRRVAVQLRHALGMDSTLNPALRRELANATDRLAIDPIDSTWDSEVQSAWRQYRALLQATYAGGPVDRIVQADRENELRRTHHGAAGRAGLKLATISTFGIYRHHDAGPDSTALLERERETAWVRRRSVAAVSAGGGGQ